MCIHRNFTTKVTKNASRDLNMGSYRLTSNSLYGQFMWGFILQHNVDLSRNLFLKVSFSEWQQVTLYFTASLDWHENYTYNNPVSEWNIWNFMPICVYKNIFEGKSSVQFQFISHNYFNVFYHHKIFSQQMQHVLNLYLYMCVPSLYMYVCVFQPQYA